MNSFIHSFIQINQSIDQSINPFINQSINWSIDQSINPFINQSIINQSIDQSINQRRYHQLTVQNHHILDIDYNHSYHHFQDVHQSSLFYKFPIIIIITIFIIIYCHHRDHYHHRYHGDEHTGFVLFKLQKIPWFSMTFSAFSMTNY